MSLPTVIVVALVTTAVLGLIDWATGFELSFAFFYLLPVGLAGWAGGARAGVLVSCACAITLLLPETDEAAAGVLLRRVRETLAREMLSRPGGGVTFSIGAVAFLAAPSSVAELLELTDQRMYSAKRGGKDALVIDRHPSLETRASHGPEREAT